MESHKSILIVASLLFIAGGLNAQVSIGGYNVYYGHLHNHTAQTDGTGTLDQAYTYARDNGKLDFFAIAEHESSLSDAEWEATKAAATTYNNEGTFVALWGFEWTHNTYGHVAVIGTTDICHTNVSPTNTFSGLVDWLATRDAVAFFNHPGRQNSTGVEFNHFTSSPTDKFVGMELWNKTDRFEDYYYTDGYFSGDGNLSWIDEANSRGWKIGAGGSEDNHSGTWGTMTNSKMAVLATAKTRMEIMNAFKARRFFSTYDKNLGLSFKIGGNEMGSTITGTTYSYQILASDGNDETFTQVQLLKKGIVIQTWTPNSTSPSLSGSLTCADGEYYYVRVKQSDNDEAISSPIWISGGNQAPVISITSPANSSVFTLPADISINTAASDPDGSLTKVEFYQGTTLLGEDLASPYSYTWNSAPAGSYSLTAKATDNEGATTISTPVAITVIDPNGPVTTSAIIATGLDDVEESAAGTVYTNSTDIELVYDSYNSAGNQTVGLRFTGMNIPKEATVTNSYIQFTCDEVTTGTCNLNIQGEATDNSTAFTSLSGNVSGRARTATSVSWVPPGWSTAGASSNDQRTPDLKTIIQEIVNRTGYTSASALAIVITGTGTRTAEAYEGSAAAAAKLVVTYTVIPAVIPTFDQIGPICQNSTPPALPAGSTNTPPITGTWSPSMINTASAGTTVYTFTPNAGQNATTTTMSITVVAEPAAPSISITDPTCSVSTGTITITAPTGPDLGYSIDGQDYDNTTGVFDGLAPGTFSVTVRNSSGCISPASTATINSQPETPSPPAIGTITQPTCSLPTGTVILNGLPSGTWTINPGVIMGNTASTTLSDLAAGTYNFTVTNSSGCTSYLSGDVVINAQPDQPDAPAVTNPPAYCQGTTAGQLTAVGTNLLWYNTATGGTGSPTAPIPSTATPGTQSYWVSQTVSSCESPRAEIVVTVLAPISPSFTQIGPLDQGSVPPALPSTSNNGISGTWNPAVISTISAGSSTYTFTPNSGQCATTTTMVISIVPVNSPPSVNITSPANSTWFVEPATISITATASDVDGTVTRVEFYQGATLLGQDLTSPYSFIWSNVVNGTYSLTTKAYDNSGAATVSAQVTITVYPLLTFSKRIATGTDDAEEYSSGAMSLNHNTIDLVYYSSSTGNQTVGLRFSGIPIPAGAIITNAYIQFGVSKKSTTACSLTIKGQAIGNAATFASTSKNVSSRTKTTASVPWSPAGWSTVGAMGTAQQTPDLKTIVQEILGTSGWTNGNSMAFIISGTGTRTAYSYEGNSSRSAQLNIKYYVPAGKSGMLISGGNLNEQLTEELNDNGTLLCFPVPFNDLLHVKLSLSGSEKVRAVRIINTLGSVMLDREINNSQFDLNTVRLPKGTYIIQVQTNQGVYNRTVIRN